jgi:hypothetical protein
MTIAAISFASANVPPPIDSSRQAFGQLVNAIRSGNLTAAQNAYSAFTQSQGTQGGGPFSQAVSQIGDALQSGDLGKAQQALAQLQQQTQASKGAHHHHGGGHHRVSDSDQSQSTTSSTSTADDPTAPATSSNLIDVTA